MNKSYSDIDQPYKSFESRVHLRTAVLHLSLPMKIVILIIIKIKLVWQKLICMPKEIFWKLENSSLTYTHALTSKFISPRGKKYL